MEWFSFMTFAPVGGLGLALIATPLGVFVVWQRQYYLDATLVYSALLCMSIGLFLETNLTVVIVSLLITWVFLNSATTNNSHPIHC